MSVWLLVALVFALALTAWAWVNAFNGVEWPRRVMVLVGVDAIAWWLCVGVVKVAAVALEEDSVLRRGAATLSVWDLIPVGVCLGSAAWALRDSVKAKGDKTVDGISLDKKD